VTLWQGSVRICDTREYADTITIESTLLEDGQRFLALMEKVTRGGFLESPCKGMHFLIPPHTGIGDHCLWNQWRRHFTISQRFLSFFFPLRLLRRLTCGSSPLERCDEVMGVGGAELVRRHGVLFARHLPRAQARAGTASVAPLLDYLFLSLLNHFYDW
jgi:hypothetical protein